MYGLPIHVIKMNFEVQLLKFILSMLVCGILNKQILKLR